MRLKRSVPCLVVFVLCIAVAGVAPSVPGSALASQSATSLVHISDVATHRHYKTGYAELGARTYVDRHYTIRQIPQGLAGGVLIRTANNDKWFNKEHLFTLTVDRDALVYVCIDQRAVKRLPSWLAGWTLTEESVLTSDWSASPMAVYGMEVKAGEPITMGGNHFGGYTGAKSNYFAVVKFEKTGSRLMEILSVSSKRSYRIAEAKRWARQFTDRRYRITAMSPELEGGVLVRTANNDKKNSQEHHLRLYMYKPATLYVAYDKRGAANPPRWLKDWKATDLTIRTSDRRASPLVVFQQSVDGDQIVELGGNRHKGGKKAWSNYFVVAVPMNPGSAMPCWWSAEPGSISAMPW